MVRTEKTSPHDRNELYTSSHLLHTDERRSYKIDAGLKRYFWTPRVGCECVFVWLARWFAGECSGAV